MPAGVLVALVTGASKGIGLETVRRLAGRATASISPIGTVLHPLPAIGARIAARDEVFRQSGLDVTYLRANGLMSNALWWVPSVRDEGRVLDATPGNALGPR